MNSQNSRWWDCTGSFWAGAIAKQGGGRSPIDAGTRTAYRGGMSGNTFGTLLRVTTAGESHGPGIVAIVDGCPAGLALDADDLARDLARRRPGQSSLVSRRDEADRPELLSGVFEGRTTGAPIAILVRNEDARPKDYEELRELYRPGHADFTWDAKYGRRDHRGGGRASARETVARVAAGAIARKLLAHAGVAVLGWVDRIGDVAVHVDPLSVTAEAVEGHPTRCPDPAAAERMASLIDAVRKQGDSIGGTATIVATGVPPGWGEPVFDKLRADLAKGLVSIPAVVGVEFGAGFAVAGARGSETNDELVTGSSSVGFASNRHGGLLGGLSSGAPIVIRCAVKPTSSLPRPQATVTRAGHAATVATGGRHDPCLLPRFVPVAEAMVALVLADHALRQRAARLEPDGVADGP